MDDRTGVLLKATAGAVVVMDPGTGAVEALGSWPTFDPSSSSGGLGQELQPR